MAPQSRSQCSFRVSLHGILIFIGFKFPSVCEKGMTGITKIGGRQFHAGGDEIANARGPTVNIYKLKLSSFVILSII